MHDSIYDFFDNLRHRYDPRDYVWDYKNGRPVPYLVIDGFLPEKILKQVQKEITLIPETFWSEFTRNGSYMKECKSFINAPTLQTVVHALNSGQFLDWLEAITGKTKIISDPHLIGAGLSESYRGCSLKLHTDFNWNDELNLNRTMSLILYLNPEWDATWGGGLDFYSFDRKQKITSILPLPNRLLIWDYHDGFIHGYPDDLDCPESVSRLNLRLFYYHSNAEPISTPHRSLYWWDEKTGQPFDQRDQK